MADKLQESIRKFKDAAESSVDVSSDAGGLKLAEMRSLATATTGVMNAVGNNMKHDFVKFSSAVSAVYAATRSEALQASKAIFDLIRLEVVLNFFQTASLFLSNIFSDAIYKVKAFWGNVTNIFSFNLSFTFPQIPQTVIYGILLAVGILTIFLLLFFFCVALDETPDEIREGHETTTWDKKKKKSKGRINCLRFTLTALIAAYLPISRVLVQIFSCETSMAKVMLNFGADISCTEANIDGNNSDSYFGRLEICDCKAWPNYAGLVIAAVIVLLIYTLGFPYYCYKLIKRNIPYGSKEDPNKRYNADGNLVDYTNKMYLYDIQHDPRQTSNPYLVLYEGFERKWCYFKIYQMLFKLILVIPVIVLWNNVVAQSIVTLSLIVLMAAISMAARPYVSDMADFMDSSGRIANFFTVLFALLATPNVAPTSSNVMTILIHTCNAINLAILLIGTFYGIEPVRNFFRRLSGTFRFSDTCNDIRGNFVKISADWNIELEIKHRVWHEFWRNLFKDKMKEYPEISERLEELERITADKGRMKIVDHFQALAYPGRFALRQYIMEQLEGVDVYWNGVSHDGHLDSKSCFGKLYVETYPFHVIMVYDDSDDYTFIYEKELDAVVQQNALPEIQRRRVIRKKLRALKDRLVYNPFQQYENHRVADGTEHYTDSKGHRHSRTRYTTVSVLMSYTSGTANVTNNTGKNFGAGFNFTLHYTDGHGIAVAPHTGLHHTIHNSCTKTLESMQITYEYKEEGMLSVILYHEGNSQLIADNLQGVINNEIEYRKHLIEDRAKKELTLSSAFWLHVFDSQYSPRISTEYYLRVFEMNPIIKSIPDIHKEGFDYLYARMDFVRSHPIISFWYLFFDDIWYTNKTSVLKSHSQDEQVIRVLNPNHPDSIAYTPMNREELEKRIKAINMLYPRRLFSIKLLNDFYKKIDELEEKTKTFWIGSRAGTDYAKEVMSTNNSALVNYNTANSDGSSSMTSNNGITNNDVIVHNTAYHSHLMNSGNTITYNTMDMDNSSDGVEMVSLQVNSIHTIPVQTQAQAQEYDESSQAVANR